MGKSKMFTSALALAEELLGLIICTVVTEDNEGLLPSLLVTQVSSVASVLTADVGCDC